MEFNEFLVKAKINTYVIKNMKEIEVKIKVKSFEPVLEKLGELSCEVSEPIIQKDIIFEKKEVGTEERNILRIRESNGRFVFTLKRDVANELDCIEKETEISNPLSMKEIIELMGYFETVRVNKKRRKCRYKDYKICFDEVDGLGLFIEAEKMSDEDGEIIQKELLEFLESLGVDVSERMSQGYDTMLERKIFHEIIKNKTISGNLK